MDDSAQRRFFLQPTQTHHRQYEALRAIVVDERSYRDVAEEFGYTDHSLRQLAYNFRKQGERDSVPGESPFFAASTWVVRCKAERRKARSRR